MAAVVNGHDFFHGRHFHGRHGERVETVEVTTGESNQHGWIRAHHRWRGQGGKVLLDELRELRVHDTPASARYIDWATTFQATRDEISFRDSTKYALLAVRVRPEIEGRRGGTISNAHGDQGSDRVFGAPSPWVDYSGPIEGHGQRGIALFDHPANFRPPLVFVRDYGLAMFNPFGNGDQRDDESFTVPQGESLTLRYRIYVHSGDVNDDIAFGQLAVDSDGQPIFRRDFPQHADGIDVFTLDGETRLLITICNTGPAYCLTADGETVWEKTQQEVSHGQAGWVGNFLPDRPGLEAVILVSGHYGIFHTFAAEDGRKLAAFEHHAGIKHPDGSRKYPDMPVKVRWCKGEDSLWVPVDRMIVDGRGRVVARLGEMGAQVVRDLRPGDTKNQLAVQAVPVDLCGDQREEVILYQPYHGKGVSIFTQADSHAAEKSYRPQKNAYNRPSYF